MANMRNFCFIIAFHKFATLENRLTYQCPSSWLVVITMKKKLARHLKENIEYWPVQMNGKKCATGRILKKPVEVVKGRILAGSVQKSPEPWQGGEGRGTRNSGSTTTTTSSSTATLLSYYYSSSSSMHSRICRSFSCVPRRVLNFACRQGFPQDKSALQATRTPDRQKNVLEAHYHLP